MNSNGKPIFLPIPNQNTININIEDIYGDIVADKISIEMQKNLDERMKFMFRLNAMSDEEIIEEILKNRSSYDLIANPSDAVKEAYKFKYEL